MNLLKVVKATPTPGPVGEILKIITLVAATILVDKIGDLIKETARDINPPVFDVNIKED